MFQSLASVQGAFLIICSIKNKIFPRAKKTHSNYKASITTACTRLSFPSWMVQVRVTDGIPLKSLPDLLFTGGSWTGNSFCLSLFYYFINDLLSMCNIHLSPWESACLPASHTLDQTYQTAVMETCCFSLYTVCQGLRTHINIWCILTDMNDAEKILETAHNIIQQPPKLP